jgi:hypothetical protein
MSLTTDMQLFEIAAKHCVALNAVVFKDQLNDMFLRPGGYIINMADSDSQGTHWVAFHIDDGKKNDAIAYFDSFGVNPPLEVRDSLKKIGIKVLVSDKHIQNINSGWCGIYVLFFLWFMQHHKKLKLEKRFENFLNLFSDDVEKNLTILKKLFPVKIPDV